MGAFRSKTRGRRQAGRRTLAARPPLLLWAAGAPRCAAAPPADPASLETLAPWYCPPPGPEARRCVRQYRFGRAPPYLEDTIVPTSVRVLEAVLEDRDVDPNYTAPAQAFLTLLESLRLMTCVGRFEACYPRPYAKYMHAELCELAEAQQAALAWLEDAPSEPVCEALFGRGEAGSVLLAIAKPLQGLVRAALPEAAPRAIGNGGTRFDYEHFFEVRARRFLQQRQLGAAPRPSLLVYPSAFSPSGLCAAAGLTVPPPESPDVEAALQRLAAAGVGLSHFVVNFGAADGACGTKDDWNADPANCLASAGAAAVLIEGDRNFHRSLRRLFGRRTNVSLVTSFVPLGNVSALLRDQLRSLPAATTSPDLLKVDVDHADCAFMAEALQVVHPKLIHLEYAPQVPPPLDYAQDYLPELLAVGLGDRPQRLRQVHSRGLGSSSGVELPGCSLAAFLRRAPGYALVWAGGEEALLARRDLHRALGVGPPPSAWEAWLRGALCSPLRSHASGGLSWAFDFRVLADTSRSEEERREMLEALFAEHGATRYSLSVVQPQEYEGWR